MYIYTVLSTYISFTSIPQDHKFFRMMFFLVATLFLVMLEKFSAKAFHLDNYFSSDGVGLNNKLTFFKCYQKEMKSSFFFLE